MQFVMSFLNRIFWFSILWYNNKIAVELYKNTLHFKNTLFSFTMKTQSLKSGVNAIEWNFEFITMKIY